jgi:hypothetical protein
VTLLDRTRASTNVVAARLLDPPDDPKVRPRTSAATGDQMTEATDLLSC